MGNKSYNEDSEGKDSLNYVKIKEGNTEDEIYNLLKEKYGEWIVYEPEVNKNTIFLWGLPLILFIFGGLLIIRKVTIK